MKLYGVDFDEVNDLINDIKTDFGSIFGFANQSGYSYSVLKRTLIGMEFTREEFYDIKRAYYVHEAENQRSFRISDEDRAAIRMCILSNFKNMKAFTKKNKEFNSVYISNVLNGKLCLRTTKFVRLENLLIKKYKLEIKLN